MLRTLALIAAALVLLPAAASAAPASLKQRALYEGGPTGRYLVDGQWLFQTDPAKGASSLPSRSSTSGWKKIKVPYAWNATDTSTDSFNGGVGWYRKDFKLPSSSKRYHWVLRFESVNYRSKIYLNGKLIGKNTGAYLPFEVRVPDGRLRRGGTNRLVVRVDSKRQAWDFPPSGLSVTGDPRGGWWNYGGILREVYLRQINGVDFTTVDVQPTLDCAKCAAKVNYKATLRNYDTKSRKVSVTARLGAQTVRLGTATVGAKSFASFKRSVTVKRPKLWSPKRPYLYNTSVTATGGDARLQGYAVKTGIRSIKVSGGRMLLNGKPLNFRGFGMHEDWPGLGFAIGNKQRKQQIDWARQAGASMLRSHYPLHPYYYEQLDKLGMLAWVEVPVYSIKTQYLKRVEVRKLAARELESAVETNRNHASVMVWSVGNELSSKPGPVQADYIRRAVAGAKKLDPTRPVGLAVAGYPVAGCQAEYGPLDVIGINEYFGWYAGPGGIIGDQTLLSDYLDSVRECYKDKAIVITEVGAEANRDGPVEERGTNQFQAAFADYHFDVYATKPWLSGALWWTLQEFLVRPNWEGGNPQPNPPLHQKAPITYDGKFKLAFSTLQRIFRSTVQWGGL
jgi:beta-glucuronidase